MDKTRFAFKPVFKLKDGKSLVKLLKQYDLKGLGGILLEDIQESLPHCEKVLKNRANEIIYVTRPTDKKKILFYNDRTANITVRIEWSANRKLYIFWLIGWIVCFPDWWWIQETLEIDTSWCHGWRQNWRISWKAGYVLPNIDSAVLDRFNSNNIEIFIWNFNSLGRYPIDARSWNKETVGTKAKENRPEKETIQTATRQRTFGWCTRNIWR